MLDMPISTKDRKFFHDWLDRKNFEENTNNIKKKKEKNPNYFQKIDIGLDLD